MLGGPYEIADTGGAAGAARPGEAEAEHGDTAAGEAAGDPRGRVSALAAGEAVREQGHRVDRAVRQLQPPGQLGALIPRERDPLGACHRPASLSVSPYHGPTRGAAGLTRGPAPLPVRRPPLTPAGGSPYASPVREKAWTIARNRSSAP